MDEERRKYLQCGALNLVLGSVTYYDAVIHHSRVWVYVGVMALGVVSIAGGFSTRVRSVFKHPVLGVLYIVFGFFVLGLGVFVILPDPTAAGIFVGGLFIVLGTTIVREVLKRMFVDG